MKKRSKDGVKVELKIEKKSKDGVELAKKLNKN